MKIFQCGYSSFLYELFRDDNGQIRATKTSIKDGTVCLEKTFGEDEDAGRRWVVERNDQDQRFTLAYMKLAENSGNS